RRRSGAASPVEAVALIATLGLQQSHCTQGYLLSQRPAGAVLVAMQWIQTLVSSAVGLQGCQLQVPAPEGHRHVTRRAAHWYPLLFLPLRQLSSLLASSDL